MTRRAKLLALGVAVAAVVVLAMTARAKYLVPRDQLRQRIDVARARVATLEERLEAAPGVRRDLAALAAASLGARADAVEHGLMAGMTALASRAGLVDIVATCDATRDVPNPLALPRSAAPAGVRKLLRSAPDLAVIQATVQGRGTLEQAAAFLADVQAQAWIHRVARVSLQPLGKDRTRFDLLVEVDSAFQPGSEAPSSPSPPLAAAASATASRARAIASRAPFSAHSAAAAQAARTPEATPPPKADEYASWRVVGVVQGRDGIEVILVHTPDKSHRCMKVGAKVIGATLVGAAGDRATFEIDGARYEVTSGDTLAARRRAV